MRKTGVRPAEPGDVEAAAALAAARSATRWSRDALAGELGREDAVFLVADAASAETSTILEDSPARDSAVGYAVARAVDEELRLLDIASAVDGRGTGRALWAALVAEGRRRGLKRLTLEVSAANPRALAFYRAAGAVEVGRRPKFYADGSDAVLMDLAL